VSVWHGKSSLGSLEAQGQWAHRPRSLMPKDALLVSGGGGQCMAGAGINGAWRRLHGGLALIR
jgi:hypothetical protein